MKDADGRYACKACFDRLGAAGPSTQAASAPAVKVVANAKAPVAVGSSRVVSGASLAQIDDDAMDLSSLVSAEKQASENVHYAEMQRCPHCEALAPAGARICSGCGFDNQTGTVAAKTKVFKQPSEQIPSRLRNKAKGPQRLAGEGNVGKWISLGMAALAVVLLFLMQGNKEACYFAIAVSLTYIFTWYIMTVVVPFSEEDTFWGVVNLFGALWPMTVFYVFFRSSSGFLRWGVLTFCLMAVCFGVAMDKLVGV